MQSKIKYVNANPLRVADLKLGRLRNNVVIVLQNQYYSDKSSGDTFALLATRLIKEQYPNA